MADENRKKCMYEENPNIYRFLVNFSLNENNYTVMKGKKCNEKSFSCDAHSDAGVSFQMQLLLEF